MRRHGRCRRKENGHTDRRTETARDPAAKFAVSFRRDLSIPLSLSPFRFISLRPYHYSLAYIRMRCAGRNLPPWKTTQRHRQSAFRRAIGPRRHSETQWKAQIRHRLPVHGNEFGKLLANRAGLLAFRHDTGFDPPPRPYTASTCPQSHPNAGNSTIGRDNCRVAIGRTHCAFPSFAKNGERISTGRHP